MPHATEAEIRLQDHEFAWMFTDAVGMFHLGRKYSSLLLLLCAVDALAKVFDPGNKNSGERYRNFLRDRLPAHTRVQNFNIRVPQRDDTFRIEYILYKYLRNPMVHEGAHLDVTEPANFAVQIDWATGAPSVHVDNDNNRVVFGGEWIVDILGGVVKDSLIEDLTRQCTPPGSPSGASNVDSSGNDVSDSNVDSVAPTGG